MSGPIIEITIVLLLILVNGLFAMAEIAVVSARRERLQALADEGRAGASTAMALARDPNRFLSTVQIGITLVGILAGAFGGATLASRLSDLLDEVSWLARYSDAVSVGIVVVFIAYLSLVLGELVPKRLGLRSPEGVAATVAPPMSVLSKLTAPIVKFLSISTETVLRLLRVSAPVEHTVTEEEIKVLMEEGMRAGGIEAGERHMVSGVFRLHDRPVRVFMTLRNEIVSLDVNDSPSQVGNKVREARHSVFPVLDGDFENVAGMAVAKDLLGHCLAGEEMDLRAMARPAIFIPETATGSDVLKLFQETGDDAALVIDENGVVEGLVTVDDILGEIAGEDLEEIVAHGEGSWVVDGRLGVDELEDLIHEPLAVPEAEEDAYYTVGGFVMARLGRVPSPGDSFSWGGVRFQVQSMDGNRVGSVMVSREKPLEADAFVD